LIEGALSIVCGLAIFFGLPKDPRKAYFLNKEERMIMDIRHEQRLSYMGSEEFDWGEIKIAFLDPKVWLWYVR